MNVVATPLTAERPRDADGFAPDGYVGRDEQLAVPLAATPVENCPPLHCAGTAANAVAVAALPVVFEGCAHDAFPFAKIPRATFGSEHSDGVEARADAVVANVAVAALPGQLPVARKLIGSWPVRYPDAARLIDCTVAVPESAPPGAK